MSSDSQMYNSIKHTIFPTKDWFVNRLEIRLINQAMLNDISFDIGLSSKSHIKVKGHRRGGVCVL